MIKCIQLLKHLYLWLKENHYFSKVPLVLFQWFCGFAQVVVKVHHTGGEKWIDNWARKQTSQISLKETEQLCFTRFPKTQKERESKYCNKARWNVFAAICCLNFTITAIKVEFTRELEHKNSHRGDWSLWRSLAAEDSWDGIRW